MNPFRSFRLSLSLVAVSVTLTIFQACTKERTESFPDGQADLMIEKSELSASTMTLAVENVSGALSVASETEALHADSEMKKLRVASVEGPEKFRPMFRELSVFARSGARVPVRFQIDERYVTALKLVSQDELAELPATEQAIAENIDGSAAVPIFKYEIEAQGAAVRVKNSLGEPTPDLRLEATDPAKATHIQLTMLVSRRQDVSLSKNDAETVFSRDRLDGATLTRRELEERLHLKVAASDEALFYVSITGNTLNLYELRSTTDSLTESQKAALAAAKNGAEKSQEIRACSELKAAKGAKSPTEKAPDKGCAVAVLQYQTEISYVVAKQDTTHSNGTGAKRPEISLEATTATSKPGALVKIEKYQEVRGTSGVDTSRLVSIDSLRASEFLLRRTVADSPNNFDELPAGWSADLEIVRFQFEDGNVIVHRADPTLDKNGKSRNDYEVLMSFPVTYFREVTTDGQGNRLAVPQLVKLDKPASGALASIDWSRNELGDVGSPFEWIESCFGRGKQSERITEVDPYFRKEAKGSRDLEMLGFSRVSSYANLSGGDEGCAYPIGSVMPRTFTFKERVSFKRLDDEDREPLMSLPYQAQKKLKFGLFTSTRIQPDKLGNFDTQDSQVSLASLYDIRGGKKITYVLAGIPESGREREMVIQGTREVVAHWNDAFRKALAGTPMARADDVIELKIEGDDIEERKLGDLDRNYIYYVQKGTGSSVIGLGGAHANPRTGKVEAASVFMYGGNIMSYVKYMKEGAKTIRNYRKRENANREAWARYVAAVKAMQEKEKTPSAAGPTAGEPAKDRAPSGDPVAQAAKSFAQGKKMDPAKKLNLRLAQSRELQQLKQDLIARGHSSKVAHSFLVQAARKAGGPLFQSKALRLSEQDQLRVLKAAGLSDNAEAREVLSQLSLTASGEQQKADAALAHRKNGCAMRANPMADSMIANSPEKLAEMDDLDLWIGQYKSTLAHELGHNLGLRHNFQGSYDGDNWKFDESDPSHRETSSVMEYGTNQADFAYDGLSPHDVAAIRVAYTGYLEIDRSVKSEDLAGLKIVSVPKSKIRLIHLDEIKRGLGLKRWENLSWSQAANLPIRPFLFCTDEDLGMEASCRQHDQGRTPLEVVNFMIENYLANYERRNFPLDKLNFSSRSVSSVFSSTAQSFGAMRLYLDDFVFSLLYGEEEEAKKLGAATDRAYQFFQQVVRTPDTSIFLDPSQPQKRFYAMDLLGDGKAVAQVERRFPRTRWFDDTRLRVVGYDYDKAAAIIMLTNGSSGSARLQQQDDRSLTFSYLDFERIYHEGEKSRIIQLMEEILLDDVKPTFMIGDAIIPFVDEKRQTFETSVSTTMNMVALQAVMLDLDTKTPFTDPVSARDPNQSVPFRIASGRQAPESAVTYSRTDGITYWSVSDRLKREERQECSATDQGGQACVTKTVMKLDYPSLSPAGKLLAKANLHASVVEGFSDSDTMLAILSNYIFAPEPRADQEADLALHRSAEQALQSMIDRLPSTYEGQKTASGIRDQIQAIAAASMQLNERVNEMQNNKQGRNAEQQARFVAAVYNEYEVSKNLLMHLSKTELVTTMLLNATPGNAIGSPILDQIKPQLEVQSRARNYSDAIETMSLILSINHPEFFR